jgi:hypothetical protein
VARSVGSRLHTSAARFRPCLPASCEGVRLVCRFSFADARGVGSSATCALSVSLRGESGGPVPLVSDTVGVGSSSTTAGRPSSYPRPLESRARGVGNEEPPLPLMGGADVGRSQTRPVRIEPETGKVTEDNVKARSSSDDGAHVFQDEEAGS